MKIIFSLLFLFSSVAMASNPAIVNMDLIQRTQFSNLQLQPVGLSVGLTPGANQISSFVDGSGSGAMQNVPITADATGSMTMNGILTINNSVSSRADLIVNDTTGGGTNLEILNRTPFQSAYLIEDAIITPSNAAADGTIFNSNGVFIGDEEMGIPNDGWNNGNYHWSVRNQSGYFNIESDLITGATALAFLAGGKYPPGSVPAPQSGIGYLYFDYNVGQWLMSNNGSAYAQVNTATSTVLPQAALGVTPPCNSNPGVMNSLYLTSVYVECVCNGTSWVQPIVGTPACTF